MSLQKSLSLSGAARNASKPASPLVACPPYPLYRFTVKQYQQMTEAGILTSSDRVELLEGWIVQKMTQNPPHGAALDASHDLLRSALPPGWYVREQKPIEVGHSLPEPDLVIVPGPARRFRDHIPAPADVALVIEVADTTLSEDRVYKGSLYARARIGTYWIINVVDNQVEVYSQPRAGKDPLYRQRHDYLPNETVPFVLEGREIARISVRELLALGDNS